MVELLAPAGEYNSFLGAINAGADAVYLAGNMYGARASAVNFEQDELIKAIKYAHLFGKKVYLTVNTLTKNEELDKLYDFLYPYYISGLDAVIVQDIGVFLYLKEAFKDLDIHVSTQAAVTSLYGAKYYTDLGAKRIVLARELTLNEIKDITKAGIETECFIHGAMCYSYSGMCLFSSYLGGNSGNRGRCKGPCRQPYKADGKEAYYLSLADMNTVEIIDKLIDAGIFSFKIEGRLKSPSYSAGVTSIYRKYIDLCLENPGVKPEIDKKDMDFLRMLYSRTSTGCGYYERTKSPKMITFEKGAYAKVDENLEKEIISKYIDKPKKIKANLYFKGTVGEKASLKMEMADEPDYNVTVYSDNLIEKASKAASGKEEVENQLNKLGNTVFEAGKNEIILDDGFIPVQTIKRLRREACELLEDRLTVSERSTDIRKPLISDVKENVLNGFSKTGTEAKDLSSGSKIAFVKKKYQLDAILNNSFYDSYVVSKEIIEDENFVDTVKNCGKKIYIELPLVLRKQNEDYFKKITGYASEKSFISGVCVNQYDAYEYLKESGFEKEKIGNLNIYSYNDISYSFNAGLFDRVFNPQELALNDFGKYVSDSMMVLFYGKARLMITANCILNTCKKCSKYIPENKYSFTDLKDRIGVNFKAYPDCDEELCFNVIYNSKPTSLHKYFDKFKKLGVKSYVFVFTDENGNETKRLTDAYKSLFEGVSDDIKVDYTAYHLKNGIL